MNDLDSTHDFMNWWQALILGTVQGLTEYLPVSSSGHLAIVGSAFGLRVPISVDILLHLATLIPAIWIFRKRIGSLLRSSRILLAWLFTETDNPQTKRWRFTALGPHLAGDSRYIILVLMVTFFTFIVAFPQKDLGLKFQPQLVAGCFLFTAFLLLLQHFLLKNRRQDDERPELDNILQTANRRRIFLLAVGLGVAQGIAALPGISRSGMTISVALLLGLRRRDAGEFSFIISIPVILGAFLLDSGKLLSAIRPVSGSSGSEFVSILLAFIAACLSGFFALRMLLALLNKGNFYIFAPYLILLSIFSFRYLS
ncbi:undecaprenyl-diphosphate phosphatase [Candidatus Haliotispira prima]|uniref:Undecaprenyl-diphosphatase n=1 Tax=Candidatus Haliotispira prima TaxID=3034016 RepID=A0ABY8MK77_9SPIO|nr:undecaprenyl-diphosphate phosphatase [Candidatus Haliotispira prima]